MYSHFGEKWVKLHRGPMWCTSSLPQGSEGDVVHTTTQHLSQETMAVYQMNLFYTMLMICTQALVNVPAVSERSIRSDFSSSKVNFRLPNTGNYCL